MVKVVIMSELDTTEMGWYQRNKTRVLLATGGVTPLMALASAGTLNNTIYPLIEDVADLFTPLLDLIIAAIPVIIAVSIIGFILGVLSSILGQMR